jgi:hypothetical protein
MPRPEVNGIHTHVPDRCPSAARPSIKNNCAIRLRLFIVSTGDDEKRREAHKNIWEEPMTFAATVQGATFILPARSLPASRGSF